MEKIKKFLRRDYREGALSISKDCIPLERLCEYAEGGLSLNERGAIESHLARCYHCLDIVVSIHGCAKKVVNQRRITLKREHIFLALAILCFVSSFIFKGYFLQSLAATIIFGIKWIVDSKSNKMLITIRQAWKRGGDKEAGRVLRDIDTRNRIDF